MTLLGERLNLKLMSGMLSDFFFSQKYEYITVLTIPVLMSVVNMVVEHYDKPEYNDTLFCINNIMDVNLQLVDVNQFGCKRKIYYYLEHGKSSWLHTTPNFKEFVRDNFTDIWSFENNVNGLDKYLDFKIMPMRYCERLHNAKAERDSKIDLGFIGICNERWSPLRYEFLDEYYSKYKNRFSLEIINGKNIGECKNEMDKCKFILDIPRSYLYSQNQVRIFECICMGYHIMCRKSDDNIFPGLITEWEDIDDLNFLVHKVQPQDFSQKYKEMTYNDADYESYRNNIIQSIGNEQ